MASSRTRSLLVISADDEKLLQIANTKDADRLV